LERLKAVGKLEKYEIRIPETRIILTAKNKKEAFKEARKILNTMLKKEDWWIEEEKIKAPTGDR
jgi:hypothetical protein